MHVEMLKVCLQQKGTIGGKNTSQNNRVHQINIKINYLLDSEICKEICITLSLLLLAHTKFSDLENKTFSAKLLLNRCGKGSVISEYYIQRNLAKFSTR